MLIDIKDDCSERVRYDYPDFPVYVRRCFLSVFPDFSADRHWHDDIELIYVISGEIKYNVSGEMVSVKAGEGMFVNSRQLHFGYSDEKKECDFICILFHPVLLCNSKMLEDKFVHPIIESDLSYLLFEDNEQNKNILQSIRQIFESKDDKSAPLTIQSCVFSLWKELFEKIGAVDEYATHSDGRISVLKKMMSFIHENHKEKITLAEIANSGGVSKRSCGYFFMKYLNQTPISYLCDYRLRKSVELLIQTDMTVLQISAEVGFSGAGYYAECFRKKYGISPANYRKQA